MDTLLLLLFVKMLLCVARFTLVIFVLSWGPHDVNGEEDHSLRPCADTGEEDHPLRPNAFIGEEDHSPRPARGIVPLGLFNPPLCIDVDQVYIPVTVAYSLKMHYIQHMDA